MTLVNCSRELTLRVDMVPPAYFEGIRSRAAARWNQLESDQELAGPWHQLFRQVQSPRHVLSELLQNADDAGAIEASVCIRDGVFIFGHNGEDFSEEHFASLCRFGFSNKKSLHTIGFRGIGFKSTFSLGDRVEVLTPTLSVAFHRDRFTEPIWIEEPKPAANRTEVHVPISDRHRRREVEKNLAEWLNSPTSLLFFRHIRRIRIEDREICWKVMGAGPVSDSEWMALTDKPSDQFLVVRSAPESFPEEALLEIKQERAFNLDDDAEFPSCQIEVVLGTEGRLFVVLPTGVKTNLPFACNAPFIQDPARLKIKDPEISPTNRWLLGRVGKLAAAAMLEWLERTDLPTNQRCRAYAIMPNAVWEGSSIEVTCETTVEESCREALETVAYLLTEDGELVTAKRSIVLPKTIFDIWEAETAARLLDDSGRPPLCRHLDDKDIQKLIRWGAVEQVEKTDILEILQTASPPKPETWQQLLLLWSYLAPELTGYAYYSARERFCILPVHGRDVLHASKEVVRLGEKRLLQSDDDWDFLSKHLLVLNQNWFRYLAEQRRTAEEDGLESLGEKVDDAYSILNTLGFKDASDVSKVCNRVAIVFFGEGNFPISDYVRLTQIAAKLGATTGDSFRFFTQDGRVRSVGETILFDDAGSLETLMPTYWCDGHLLHPDYSQSFPSCTQEEWIRWISSGKAGLFTFVPPIKKKRNVWGRPKIEKEVQLRGCTGKVSYPYSRHNFVIEDWDFDDNHWRHWKALAGQDSSIWGKIMELILAQPQTFWQKCKSARALQVATNGNTRAITYEDLLPAWILKFRELPCLPDTRGSYHKPGDLLRRTPETESLLDVEPFIHGRWDNETVRPVLRLLGVRDTPTGPDRLLDCLRALSRADNPPVYEVEKWYHRLDHMIDVCSTDDLRKIRQAFAEEPLILTESERWDRAAGVFLSSNEEDVPEAEVVRPSVKYLSLWRKVGVAERPTAELAIEWLKGLPSGQTLPQDETNRVRALLTRHPQMIWTECGHWLNLAGEWAPVETLGYALTMQSLVPWKHLHEWVKKKTADFQRLPAEISEASPFCMLPALAAHIEERFLTRPNVQGESEPKPWLSTLGAELRRIILDTAEETERIRCLASRLQETVWRTAPGLEVIPYINGVPGGTPRQAEATWLDKVLYVEERPLPKLARNVAQELGRVFRRQDISDAIKLCFEHPPEFVIEYLEENFNLEPRQKAEQINDEVLSVSNSHEVPEAKIQPETEVLEAMEKSSEELKDTDISANKIQEAEHHTEQEENSTPEATSFQGNDEELAEEIELVTRKHVKPVIPSVIERFASLAGFSKTDDDRFYREDGSLLQRVSGAIFPWELLDMSGEVVRHYWQKDHCIERAPLELDTEVWSLCEKFPDKYSLILSSSAGTPIEISGRQLKEMAERNELALYPAKYRLVYRSDEEFPYNALRTEVRAHVYSNKEESGAAINFELLIRKIENSESVPLSVVEQMLPSSYRNYAREVLDRVHDLNNLIYLFATIEFYNPLEKALEVIYRSIPLTGDWYKRFDFKAFYYASKTAYERRCNNQIAHNPDLLKYALDFSPSMPTVCSSPQGVRDDDENPCWHDGIRHLEGD